MKPTDRDYYRGRSANLWARMSSAEHGEQYINVKAGSPLFQVFSQCRNGQMVAVSGQWNGRRIKDITRLDKLTL
jgi:hypothetical protein